VNRITFQSNTFGEKILEKEEEAIVNATFEMFEID